jgi:hypothetical protein
MSVAWNEAWGQARCGMEQPQPTKRELTVARGEFIHCTELSSVQEYGAPSAWGDFPSDAERMTYVGQKKKLSGGESGMSKTLH